MSSQLHKSTTHRDHVSQAIEIVRQRDRDSVWMQMERGNIPRRSITNYADWTPAASALVYLRTSCCHPARRVRRFDLDEGAHRGQLSLHWCHQDAER